MTLLKLFGFSIYWQISRSLLILLLSFGMIILVLHIYLRILFFMLAQNMLKLIIILYEIGLQRRRFRFVLSPPRINLQMFSLSHFLLFFASNFKSILHPQFEEAYYRMIYRKYYRHYSSIVISTYIIVYRPTYINRTGLAN